jgi:hypothetical protein
VFGRVVARSRSVVGAALERTSRSALSFELRVRLYWRLREGTWIARRPDTFSGKVRWRMLKDRRPLLRLFADKAAVRDYVAAVIGPEHLTACHAIVRDPAEIDPATLPREYVAKVNHGSGGIWIVSDRAPAGVTVHPGPDATPPYWPGSGWNQVLTRPSDLDWDLLVRTFRAWLALDYSRRFYVEWAYRGIPARMIVEELLRDSTGAVPADYKIYVFHGHARLIQVNTGRFEQFRVNFYRPDWTPVDADWLDGDVRHPRAPAGEAPASLPLMLQLAEALGEETDFVRVDLYDVDGRVVFGELTSTPAGGNARFEPHSFDLEVGSWW